MTAREVRDKNVNVDIFSVASLKSDTFSWKDLSWQISLFLIKKYSETLLTEMRGFMAHSCKIYGFIPVVQCTALSKMFIALYGQKNV